MMRTIEKYGLFGLGVIAVALVLACGGGGGGGGGGGITDTTPPTIGSLAVSPSLLTPGTQTQVSATVTDADSGVQAVVAIVTYPDNTQASVTLSVSGSGSTYGGTFTAQWTPSGTGANARVQLRAVDRAGNQAQTETTVRTAGMPPSPPF
ncbi:MAG: hypothetical protein NZL85_04745 [Fimbriimonadales bacterium]|nr:hypothetical protein [Fimbriimonadales bacterium]